MLCFSQDQLMITMTRPSKRKIQYKKQERSDNGRFIKKLRLTDDSGMMVMVGERMMIAGGILKLIIWMKKLFMIK